MNHRTALGAAMTVSLGLLGTRAAHAEPPAPPESDYTEYHFEDDPLHGAGTSPYGEWLKVRPRHQRVLLIRPRASFVMELLASIGKL